MQNVVGTWEILIDMMKTYSLSSPLCVLSIGLTREI